MHVFGHKDTTENMKEKIKNTVIQLIENDGIKTFYVGNNAVISFYANILLDFSVFIPYNISERSGVFSKKAEKTDTGGYCRPLLQGKNYALRKDIGRKILLSVLPLGA